MQDMFSYILIEIFQTSAFMHDLWYEINEKNCEK
jgi:hypothetical protein